MCTKIGLYKELEFIPDSKIKQVEIIRERLVSTGIPTIIVLYCSFPRGEWEEQRGVWSGAKSDFGILAVTENEIQRLRELVKGDEKRYVNI